MFYYTVIVVNCISIKFEGKNSLLKEESKGHWKFGMMTALFQWYALEKQMSVISIIKQIWLLSKCKILGKSFKLIVMDFLCL